MRVFGVEAGTRGAWEGGIVVRAELLRGRLSVV